MLFPEKAQKYSADIILLVWLFMMLAIIFKL